MFSALKYTLGSHDKSFVMISTDRNSLHILKQSIRNIRKIILMYPNFLSLRVLSELFGK